MRSLLVVTIGLAVAACSDSLVEGGRPFTVEVTASSSTAAVGEEIHVVVEATGENLIGVAIDFGDGAVDSTATSGAVTAGITRTHAWDSAGTYMVVGAAADLQALGIVELADTVSVLITETGG